MPAKGDLLRAVPTSRQPSAYCVSFFELRTSFELRISFSSTSDPEYDSAGICDWNTWESRFLYAGMSGCGHNKI